MPVWITLLGYVCKFCAYYVDHRRILNIKGNSLTVKAIDKGYDFETTSANLRELDDVIRSVPALVKLMRDRLCIGS